MVVSISPGKAVYRSSGGVKAKYTPAKVYKYYPTPITYSTLDMSDFGSWSNSTAAPVMYSPDSVVNLPLVHGITGASIGMITADAICTPKMRILDLLGAPQSINTSEQACSFVLTELTAGLAQSFMVTDDTPPRYSTGGGQIRLAMVASGGTYLQYSSGSLTLGIHASIPGNYYLYPGSTTIGLARSGDNFYPHRIKVNVDVDLDAWYEEKYTDAPYTWITPGPPAFDWTNTPSRHSESLTSATAAIVDAALGYGNFNMSYSSCYNQVSQCLLPVTGL